MKKVLLITILMLSVPIMLRAQSSEKDAKEQISKVLQQEDAFLYADQTCATAEQALQRALDILDREIERYLGQDASDAEVVKGTITDKVVTITISRGDKYRAFVYIDKNGLDFRPKETKIEEVQVQSHSEPAIQTEREEVEQTTQVIAEKEKTSVVITPTVPQVEKNSNSEGGDEKTEVILSMHKKNQLYDYITMLKNDGEEADWYAQPYSQSNSNQMYLVLYRRSGDIEAILSPANGNGERVNIATGEHDSRANHPGTSVNGFIINK